MHMPTFQTNKDKPLGLISPNQGINIMAGSSLAPASFQSSFINKSQFLLLPQRTLPSRSLKPSSIKPISAKFNLVELLGGRGLCNGEAGLQQELKKDTTEIEAGNDEVGGNTTDSNTTVTTSSDIPESGFEKELLGLTGGFPGGEMGLKKFIEKNPPPTKKPEQKVQMWMVASSKKPKPPELPLLLPGMIAIVKNPSNPFYMYCGIVQRITDGKAGVLFEGGNWDRLVTFRLDELERREKGPPMVNPKSVVLEPLIEQLETQPSE